MKLFRIALLSAAAAALLSAADASAQLPATATFTVSATVAKNCVIDAATDIAISDATTPWDPTTTANPTATGTITVRCTRGTTYTIDLNGGVYTDVLSHATDATAKLPFKLYAADCATAFTPISVTAATRKAKDTTICAGIDTTDATLDPIAGNYSKNVTVDVTF